jgi:hypothetical protein
MRTIKLDGKEWYRLSAAQAERLGLGYCWDDGLLVDADCYRTGTTADSIWYNAHPHGRHPVCSYLEWINCSVAPDDLIDLLVSDPILRS